eukprot:scaffold340_cov256-Pinguiococcus_pyrenoidosus.AAC.24
MATSKPKGTVRRPSAASMPVDDCRLSSSLAPLRSKGLAGVSASSKSLVMLRWRFVLVPGLASRPSSSFSISLLLRLLRLLRLLFFPVPTGAGATACSTGADANSASVSGGGGNAGASFAARCGSGGAVGLRCSRPTTRKPTCRKARRHCRGRSAKGRGVPEVQSLQEHIPVRHPRNSAQRDEVVRPGAQEASSAAFSV